MDLDTTELLKDGGLVATLIAIWKGGEWGVGRLSSNWMKKKDEIDEAQEKDIRNFKIELQKQIDAISHRIDINEMGDAQLKEHFSELKKIVLENGKALLNLNDTVTKFVLTMTEQRAEDRIETIKAIKEAINGNGKKD